MRTFRSYVVLFFEFILFRLKTLGLTNERTDQQIARRYLQEHTAALVYARLSHARRGRVEELARLAPALLREATVSLRSPRRAA